MDAKEIRRQIFRVMSDGQPRTSYQIADLIFGGHATPPQWWGVSSMLDRLAINERSLDVAHDGHAWRFRRLTQRCEPVGEDLELSYG